jgi:hypothetical protein
MRTASYAFRRCLTPSGSAPRSARMCGMPTATVLTPVGMRTRGRRFRVPCVEADHRCESQVCLEGRPWIVASTRSESARGMGRLEQQLLRALEAHGSRDDDQLGERLGVSKQSARGIRLRLSAAEPRPKWPIHTRPPWRASQAVASESHTTCNLMPTDSAPRIVRGRPPIRRLQELDRRIE